MTLRERLRCERGYTLIELVMATVAGLVVCAAALAVVISSLSFADNDADRVNADQQGSAAMERIVQVLNSSCVEGWGNSPIVGATGPSAATGSTGAPPSSGDTLTLFSSLADSPNINPSEISISLSSNGGPLLMATYPYVTSTGASGTTGYYSPTPSTYTLLTHAAEPGTTPTQGSTTPIFTYYGYDASSGTLIDQFSPSSLTSPLGAAYAARTAEVAVHLQSQPDDGSNHIGGSTDLSDSVVLRLTAVGNGSTGATGSTTPQPCS
jgi:Tfp pilus assembly protein PilW